MSFCPNCGTPLNDEEKFCHACGSMVSHEDGAQRKQEYTGKIIKCPNCGEVLKSFLPTCPACGYELRGVKASDTVRELALRLEKCESLQQRVVLVRNFPIPNTKEDILEFIIMATTNLCSVSDDNIDMALYDAWMVKLEQCYQKAELLFCDDQDFRKIQEIYDGAKRKINKKKVSESHKSFLKTLTGNVGTILGLFAICIALWMDLTGKNAAMVEMLGLIAMIVSACLLARRSAGLINFLLSAVSGIVTIILSFFFSNGSMLQLFGGVIIIISVVRYNKNKSNRQGE